MYINKSQYINNLRENSKLLLLLIDKKHKDFIGNNENNAQLLISPFALDTLHGALRNSQRKKLLTPFYRLKY